MRVMRTLLLRTWLALAALSLVPALALAQVQPKPSVLRKLHDTGVITLGYRSNQPPFSYVDEQLQPIGYSVELCQRIVDSLRQRPELRDLEVRWLTVNAATRLPLVANGTVDLECGTTTNNAERQRIQTFSVTTFVAESRLLSRRESPVRQLDDLRGQSVASTIGTTSIQYLNALNQQRQLGMKILAGVDDLDGMRMLEAGRVRAFLMDDVLLRSLVAMARDPSDYVISEQALSVEPYGIGLTRHDPEFKTAVDEVLVRLFRSGEIMTIYRRWFQSPIPPRGVNLELPMGPTLRRVIAQPTDSPDPERYR